MAADCPRVVRMELEEVFNAVQDSESQAMLYEIDSSRVDYLYRWARYIKDQAALESTESFPEDHPIYGLGIYWNIHVVKHEAGLYVYIKDAVELTDAQILINAVFRKKEVTITTESEAAAKRVIMQLHTKKAKLMKRWNCDQLREVSIRQEQNRVVVTLPNALTYRLKPVSLSEIDNVLKASAETDENPD